MVSHIFGMSLFHAFLSDRLSYTQYFSSWGIQRILSRSFHLHIRGRNEKKIQEWSFVTFLCFPCLTAIWTIMNFWKEMTFFSRFGLTRRKFDVIKKIGHSPLLGHFNSDHDLDPDVDHDSTSKTNSGFSLHSSTVGQDKSGFENCHLRAALQDFNLGSTGSI